MLLKLLRQLNIAAAIEGLQLVRERLRRRSLRKGRSSAVGRIYPLVADRTTILVAAGLVMIGDGARTPGGDGMTCRDFHTAKRLQLVLDRIQHELETGTYEPQLARIVRVPKADGGWRQLHVPSLTDRIVQTAAYLILEAILDQRFSSRSYGFRVGRNPHQAVDEAVRLIREHPIDFALKLDIQQYFDNVDHAILVALLREHVADQQFVDLVERMLGTKARRKNGDIVWTGRGVPQGGCISPLLSNLYLDGLDKLFDPPGGRFGITGGMRANQHGLSLRFADDVLVLAPGSRPDLERIYDRLGDFLAQVLKLRFSRKKTALADVREGVPFLGFILRKNQGLVRVEPEQARVDKFVGRMTHAIDACPLDVPEDVRLRAFLQPWDGWVRYVGHATDHERIQAAARDLESQYAARFHLGSN